MASQTACICSFPAGACIDTHCRCHHHGYAAPPSDPAAPLREAAQAVVDAAANVDPFGDGRVGLIVALGALRAALATPAPKEARAMSDTDTLAALLHHEMCTHIDDPNPSSWCVDFAARLHAAGVRVADPAAPLREALGTASDTIDRMGWELDALRDAALAALPMIELRPHGFTGLNHEIPWFRHGGISHGADRPDCLACQTEAALRAALTTPAPKEADRG